MSIRLLSSPVCIRQCLLLVSCLLVTGYGHGQTVGPDFNVTTELLVQTGQPAPDGNGVFSDTIVFPVLNDAGQVLVWANLLATTDPGPLDDWGFFVADGNGVDKVLRGGEPSVDGNLLRLDIAAVAANTPQFNRPYGIDASGRLVVAAPDNAGQVAAYRGDGSNIELLLQEGDVVGAGNVANIAAFLPLTMQANDPGEISFISDIVVDGVPQQFGIMRAGDGAVTPLLLSGQLLPDGRTVSNIALQNATLNNHGRAAAALNTQGSGFNVGIYASDGVDVVKLLHTGEPAPDGLGTLIAGVGLAPQQNNLGQMLTWFNVDDIAQDYLGLFQGDGVTLAEVGRTGGTAPTGTIFNFTGDARINDNDTLVYGAVVNTSLGLVQQLLMRRGGATIPIVSAFDMLPEPIGLEVRDPFTFALNEQDQVMFTAFVIAEGLGREALFLFDPEFGLALVARTGQPFAGDVLADIEVALPFFPNTMRYTHNAQNAFNNLGQQAFYYRLQNGLAGVALASTEFIPDKSDLLFRDGFETL